MSNYFVGSGRRIAFAFIMGAIAGILPIAAFAAESVSRTAETTNDLQSYVGNYKLPGEYAFVAITVSGSHLTSTVNGQPSVDLTAEGGSRFSANVKTGPLSITFVRGADGNAQSLELQQHGHTVSAQRIQDDATVERLKDALGQRKAGQQPFAGSDAAIRHVLYKPDDLSGFSPQLAQTISGQRSAIDAYLAKLGPIASYEFIGVAASGADKYVVRHANGSEEVLLTLNDTGTIVGVARHRL